MKKSIKQNFLLVFTFWFLCSCNTSHVISRHKLLQKVDSMLVDKDGSYAPGSAILVAKDGKILVNKGYGFASLEHKIPITSNTVFDLASLSKQFTGFAVSLLIEQGKISPGDDIHRYIPELPDFGYTITIDHLLHHTSGLRDWVRTLTLAGWSFEDVISYEQILRMAYNQKELNFVPGTQFSYSNTGYNLLAELVQRVTGESFSDWTRQNIFFPLNMMDSQFLDDHTKIISNRANAYYKDNNGEFHINPDNLTALGSSSLFSTTTDLAKWIAFLENPDEKAANVVERMYQQGLLNNGEKISYAYGLEINDFRNTKWIGHSGEWASFFTYLVLIPEYKLSIVVLSNHQSNPSKIARDIASFFVPEPEKINVPAEQITTNQVELSSNILNDYIGTYKFGPGWYVTISRNGNQLWSQATGEKNHPMKAISDTVFQVPSYGGRTMTFIQDSSRKVSQLKFDGEIRPKMEGKSTFDPDNIKQYIGKYYSEELETIYHVIYEGEQLKLKHFRHGIINLTPAWNDEFLGSKTFIRFVDFYRDKNGNVTGFNVSDTRTKHQQFKKL